MSKIATHQEDTFIEDDDEEMVCPLCIEEFDISDRHFKPCPCGYQVCQFCYNNIRRNPELNGRCPGCRRPYDDATVEYPVISQEEWKQDHLKQAKKEKERKQKERERKEMEVAHRKHLAGMRVVQKNLVYVVGLNPRIPYEELHNTLRGDLYFGQYGKIQKIVVNKRANGTGIGVYVTYAKKEDAERCIAAVDGSVNDGKPLRAAYGTTKYCSYYLRNQPCPNINCMFLHEAGEEADSYTRQDLSTMQHAANQSSHTTGNTTYISANNLTMPSTSSAVHHHLQLNPNSSLISNSSSNSNFTNNSSSSSSTIPSSVQSTSTGLSSFPNKNSPRVASARLARLQSLNNDVDDGASALPPTASWATKSTQASTANTNKHSINIIANTLKSKNEEIKQSKAQKDDSKDSSHPTQQDHQNQSTSVANDNKTFDKKSHQDKSEKSEKSEKSVKHDGKIEKLEKVEKAEKTDKFDKSDKHTKNEKINKIDKSDKTDKSDKLEKVIKESSTKPSFTGTPEKKIKDNTHNLADSSIKASLATAQTDSPSPAPKRAEAKQNASKAGLLPPEDDKTALSSVGLPSPILNLTPNPLDFFFQSSIRILTSNDTFQFSFSKLKLTKDEMADAKRMPPLFSFCSKVNPPDLPTAPNSTSNTTNSSEFRSASFDSNNNPSLTAGLFSSISNFNIPGFRQQSTNNESDRLNSIRINDIDNVYDANNLINSSKDVNDNKNVKGNTINNIKEKDTVDRLGASASAAFNGNGIKPPVGLSLTSSPSSIKTKTTVAGAFASKTTPTATKIASKTTAKATTKAGIKSTTTKVTPPAPGLSGKFTTAQENMNLELENKKNNDVSVNNSIKPNKISLKNSISSALSGGKTINPSTLFQIKNPISFTKEAIANSGRPTATPPPPGLFVSRNGTPAPASAVGATSSASSTPPVSSTPPANPSPHSNSHELLTHLINGRK